ncbi:hypothetical protein C4K04_4576 [Pseudomonas chlororaphis]|uniref:Uncharacterized protein n=1 Tax=Pseudomonas chlororaphis TaxID=587753 RepID=A0A3G7TT00_9PSED|nr:hypothetical protein C4K04_4576 [Pseudomonas chlororaphis]
MAAAEYRRGAPFFAGLCRAIARQMPPLATPNLGTFSQPAEFKSILLK